MRYQDYQFNMQMRGLSEPAPEPTPEAPKIVAAVICPIDRYRDTFMVELEDGSYHDVDCWYWDERFVSSDEAGRLIGKTLRQARDRLDAEDVARIRSWV